MAEYIKQQIESGKKSICDSCFHRNVCKEIGNQTCTKCSHYQDAADVAPVRNGRWIAVPSSDMMTGKAYKCSECNKMRYGSFMPNYCQNCGAKMDGGN